MEWFQSLSLLGKIYFWLGVAATAFLILQIVLMCFSAFGGDLDIDGDGDIDVDTDSGVSVFTVKSVTAFFAVGAWAGLLTEVLVPEGLEWLSIIVAVVAGLIAMLAVVFLMRFLVRLQYNGTFDPDKLVGQRATVYVTIPPARSGKGKITLEAQGRFTEMDAVTDDSGKLSVNESVEIVSVENDCTVVKRIA